MKTIQCRQCGEWLENAENGEAQCPRCEGINLGIISEKPLICLYIQSCLERILFPTKEYTPWEKTLALIIRKRDIDYIKLCDGIIKDIKFHFLKGLLESLP